MKTKEPLKGRYITATHVEALKNGVFKTLFEYIKADPELTLEIRMNNTTMIYYQKCKILTTHLDRNDNPIVSMLEAKYYNGNEDQKPSVDIEDIRNLRSKTKIENYFKSAKKLIYFFKKKEEFIYQQNIAMGNHSYDNKYLVVDMEWQFPQEGVVERISRTRPDLVVVDTEKNEEGYNDIYLAEIKVGIGAKGGKSGIVDHLRRTNEIIDSEPACAALVKDVESIIDNKTALGLITGKPKSFRFAKKPKMMLFSAYRGNAEKQEFEKEAKKANDIAKKEKLIAPKCIYYNIHLSLKDTYED